MNTITDNNKRKLELCIDVLDTIVDTGIKIVRSFDKSEYRLEEFVYISFFERFIFSLDSIWILLKQYNIKPFVEGSIGLIIRTSLLDLMIISYIVTIKGQIENGNMREEEFETMMLSIFTDNILSTFSYLKLMKTLNDLSEDEYKKAIDSIRDAYGFLFSKENMDYDNPSKSLITRQSLKISEIYKILFKDELTKRISKVYDLYNYYSKYEHFGIMSHIMQREDINNSFRILLDGLTYVILGVNISFAFLGEIVIDYQRNVELFNTLFDEYAAKIMEVK